MCKKALVLTIDIFSKEAKAVIIAMKVAIK
jgi:hypothetical protein